MNSILIQSIRSYWRGQQSLGQRFASSTLMVFIEKFFIKGAQFIRTVIVARLLFPEDFGLFAIASLTLTLTDVFFQTGFESALIYDKEDPKKYLNSAWTVNIIRGIVLGVLMYFVVAPLVGDFF